MADDGDYITVKSSNWDGDGKITTEKVRKDSAMIQGYYAPKTSVDPADIGVYNSLTPSDTKKMQNNQDYREFIDTKKKVMDNPDAKLEDILEYSRGGKDISDTTEQQLAKYNQALNQLGPLQDSISKTDTGPILGVIRSYNPYDADAQKLKAQINSLIPNLARGVYGEVGVLTAPSPPISVRSVSAGFSTTAFLNFPTVPYCSLICDPIASIISASSVGGTSFPHNCLDIAFAIP